jgi:hypothetical protein
LQDETIDEVATPAETPTLPRDTPTFTKEQRISSPDNKTPSGNGQWITLCSTGGKCDEITALLSSVAFLGKKIKVSFYSNATGH